MIRRNLSTSSGIAAGLAAVTLFCSGASASLPVPSRGTVAMSTPVVETQPGSHLSNIADLVEKLSRMSKPEREKILTNLPLKTRENIEKGLQHLDGLPPVQKQKALERFRAFTTLDTRQKDEIRGAMGRFRALPEGRRTIVKTEMDALHQMSKAQRDHYMVGAEFKSRFSPGERSILEELTTVMPKF